ncbi:MAG: 2-oxoglutarate dehydrogenase complex dihydrolipoyllysine-residue succinyltransferase [Verrucomicrobia bacterium]|nr:2-oxoglutarate dehydrogenase complex dihydrolipoyllysine-residue succinyltransferase [Verrucomicrobiota bacterium]
MPIELKVPPVGESVTEVQIGEWLKAEGSGVEKDQTVVTLESEKATLELPAPEAGVVSKILKKRGETAKVGEVIGLFEAGAVGVSTVAARSTAAQAPVASPMAKVMPAAARALAVSGVNAAEVTASGPGGRMLKEDVARATPAAQPSAAAPSVPSAAPPKAPPGKAASATGRDEEIVPMSPLRRTVARRLLEAQNTMAMLTTFNEVDMSAVMSLRKTHQEAFQAKYQVKLGFMSFFVKAAVDALRLAPQLNAEIRGDSIVYRNYQDIGVAVGGGKGLVVPVLRGAERMSFAEVEIAINEFARRAKENKIKMEELEGGTFTLSNGGVYGSMLSTPIINPPQSGILGLHAIQDRPVAVEGQVVIRPMMFLALSYDHRIVDGREAVTFLKRVKDVIENPARILLEV